MPLESGVVRDLLVQLDRLGSHHHRHTRVEVGLGIVLSLQLGVFVVEMVEQVDRKSQGLHAELELLNEALQVGVDVLGERELALQGLPLGSPKGSEVSEGGDEALGSVAFGLVGLQGIGEEDPAEGAVVVRSEVLAIDQFVALQTGHFNNKVISIKGIKELRLGLIDGRLGEVGEGALNPTQRAFKKSALFPNLTPLNPFLTPLPSCFPPDNLLC